MFRYNRAPQAVGHYRPQCADEEVCCLCLDVFGNTGSGLFQPCQHRIHSSHDCAGKFLKDCDDNLKERICPLCRQPFELLRHEQPYTHNLWVALADFEGDEYGEEYLSLRKHCYVRKLETSVTSEGWWFGSTGRAEGWFPPDYCQRVSRTQEKVALDYFAATTGTDSAPHTIH